MNSFQQTIGIMLSFLAASILVPLYIFGLQGALPVWVVLSVIWLAISYVWLKAYRDYRRSSFKSFEAWWIADQMKITNNQ